VQIQRAGEFKWVEVPKEGAKMRGGLVTVPRGGSATIRGAGGSGKVGSSRGPTLITASKHRIKKKKDVTVPKLITKKKGR
jgi:hypothetical protein